MINFIIDFVTTFANASIINFIATNFIITTTNFTAITPTKIDFITTKTTTITTGFTTITNFTLKNFFYFHFIFHYFTPLNQGYFNSKKLIPFTPLI